MKLTQPPSAAEAGPRVAIVPSTASPGHREVIRDSDTVLTSSRTPRGDPPDALPKCSLHTVASALIAGLGVEELARSVRPRLASKTAEHSSRGLIDRLGAERGRWGRTSASAGAKGDAEFLRSRPEFETRVVPLVEVEGETVSSSHVRGLVAAGEVAKASSFLGGPFLFEGEVVQGDRRGRELGMPTANIVPDDALACPGHGWYAAWSHGHPRRDVGSGRPSTPAAYARRGAPS